MYISPKISFQSTHEVAGGREDLKSLIEDKWLSDTEVTSFIQEHNSLWHVFIIYISIHDPLKFICKKIDTYRSMKKAKTFADLLVKGIHKDIRGHLKSNRHALNFCQN